MRCSGDAREAFAFEERPPVSVVIPAYNNAGVLAQAVASVRSQQWSDMEIIVVDDGSTDDTPLVLEAISGPDLLVIPQANAGPAAARNAGIHEARNEWIAFLDADDEWLPGKLAAQFEAIAANPGARFSYTDSLVLCADGREHLSRVRKFDGPLILELIWGNMFATPTLLVHRACFEKVGVFDTVLRTGEDWDMWLRLAVFYEAVYVPKPLVLVHRGVAPRKYPVELLEICTRRVVERLYSSEHTLKRYPELNDRRRLVYSRHDTVIAKSYFRQGAMYRGGKALVRALKTRLI